MKEETAEERRIFEEGVIARMKDMNVSEQENLRGSDQNNA